CTIRSSTARLETVHTNRSRFPGTSMRPCDGRFLEGGNHWPHPRRITLHTSSQAISRLRSALTTSYRPAIPGTGADLRTTISGYSHSDIASIPARIVNEGPRSYFFGTYCAM